MTEARPLWDMTSLRRRAVVAGSRDISRRIRCALISVALALVVPGGAAAQHFPSEEDLTALIRSRVEEDRAVGIVLGVLEADGTGTRGPIRGLWASGRSSRSVR